MKLPDGSICVTNCADLLPPAPAAPGRGAGRGAAVAPQRNFPKYKPEYLDPLAKFTQDGIGDVDIHIHHNCEGEEKFLDKMCGFIEVYAKAWLAAAARRQNRVRLHSRQLGAGQLASRQTWCGLNNEITLLRDLGCYADFTMPSGASPTQGRVVNQIYWVNDDLTSRARMIAGQVRTGQPGQGDLLITGDGAAVAQRFVPRLETGEIAWQDFPTPYRISRWLDLAPHQPGNFREAVHARRAGA